MATRTISTKLAVEGEAEYKQAIAACNSELTTLKSGLALVESEFRSNANSMEALAAKGTALDSMYKKQQEKVTTLEAALKNAQRAQEEYAARVSTAKENIERCEKALDELKNSTGDTSEEQKKLTEELDRWNSELSEAEAGQAAAERGVQNWQKQLNNAQVDLNNLSDEIGKNNQYLSEAGESADGCAKSIDEYGKEVKEAGKESSDLGNKSKDAINQLAAALAAAGVAKAVEEIFAALKECVDTFASFESQMSTVQAISGATGEQMAALAEKAKYMGATTAFTATEAAQAFEYMAMAGWKTDEMLDGLDGIMYLAAASGEDLASVSDIVTDALTAFGLAASDSAHFADVLAAASSSSNTNVSMMGETFKYAAPVAGALGYSIEDTALAIGLMANAGTKGSEAGTALRGVLTNLAKPSDTVAAYMNELGISLTDNAGNTRSLSELMEILRERFANLTEAEKAEYAAGLAGKEGMTGLLAIVNASDADFQKLTGAITNCNGAAYEMSQIRLDNLAGQMTLFESAVDGLKLAVGEQLAPVLRNIYEIGTNAFSWATEFVEENEWIVGAITGVTVALGALALDINALSVGLPIIAAVKSALALLVANPVVAVTAAVVGFAAAVATWVSASQEAGESTKALMESVEESRTAYEENAAAMAQQQESTAATTAATAAALEELLAVEEKSAAQKEAIKKMVDELNESVLGLALAYDEMGDAINMDADALERFVEKAAKQEEYEAQVSRLSELYREQAEISARLEAAQDALSEAQETGSGNTRTLQNDINELTAAQEANAQQIAELEEASREYGEQQAEAAQKTREMTSRMDDIIGKMKELQEEYEKSYEKAHESIDSQLGLFNELDGTAKTSIDNLIETLKGQVEYMETYAENIQRAMEMGVDEGLVRKLSDGSEESAQILAAIVQGGEEDIAALNEELAKVEEGKENFSNTVAEMETNFSDCMEELVLDLKDAIQDMDLADETYRIGENNIQGLINGTVSKKRQLVSEYINMGREAMSAYQREVGQASPSRKFKRIGQYDIQGIIQGVEAEKPKFAAAYEEAARLALSSMERALPSSIEVPSASAAINNQTAAIMAAVSGRGGETSPIQIHIDKMEIRDESDVERVARELYLMAAQESRSRGGGL